jgi:hypothetical protein
MTVSVPPVADRLAPPWSHWLADGALPAHRARLYRLVLALAAVYNAAFGVWAGLFPHSFFELTGMAPPLYPAVWRCLGMVVGVYGLAYAYAAARLDLGRPFVLIGLLGKLLGPAGWVITVASGEWPLRTFTLIVFNDLVWWLPFALYLLDGGRAGSRLAGRLRAAAPFACAALNALAAVALLIALRPGTEAVADPAARAAYIAAHPILWRGGWLIWMAAAVSLLGFYAWWGARVERPGWATAAFVVAAAGLVCDLFAESLYIGWFPERLVALQRPCALLTSGAANGLYTLAGIVLTRASPWLRGWARGWAWGAWAAGLALSAAAALGSAAGMAASGALLMALFCPWAAWMGWRFGGRLSRP